MFRLSRVWPSAAALGELSVCFALPAQAGIELVSKLPSRYISDTQAISGLSDSTDVFVYIP